LHFLHLVANIFISQCQDNALNNSKNKVEKVQNLFEKSSLDSFLFLLLFLTSLFDFLMVNLLHISLRHTDHHEIGKNVKEKDRHTDEVDRRNVRVDEVGKFRTNGVKVRVEDGVIHC